ncbi:MAG: Eco57I restriction-modification methylase domain-containing protein, partial [Desulfobaccales bacterium]
MNFSRKPIIKGKKHGGRPRLFENQKKTRVSVTMSKSILDLIDKTRGKLPRSRFIESMLESSSPEIAPSREQIKLNGAVYTPTLLANYVANKVVTYFLQDAFNSNNSAMVNISNSLNPSNWRFLDPACGDGELLIAAWQYLIKALPSYSKSQCINKVINPDEILCGIDIDSNAISKTRFKIQQLSTNHPDYIKVLKTNALYPFNLQTSAAGWEKVCDQFDSLNGFDILIANPPWGANVDSYKEKLAKKEFSLYQGQFDSADLFIELALKIVKPGGYFAFIIPDSLFNLERTPLRKLLVSQTEIRFIGRFGEKFFDKINRACAVIICKNISKDANINVECLRLSASIRKRLIEGNISFSEVDRLLSHKIPQERFRQNRDYMFDIDILVEEERTLNLIKNSMNTFRDYLHSSRGVELSKYGKVYQCHNCMLWFPFPNSTKRKCPHCNEVIIIENNKASRIISQDNVKSYTPMIVGENIYRYHIQRNVWIDTNKQGIKYKDASMYFPPKLLVRKTGVGICAMIDYTKSLTNQVVYIFKPIDGIFEPLPLEFFLAIINSRAIYYHLVKNYGETEWRSHPYITQKQVLDLPIPNSE